MSRKITIDPEFASDPEELSREQLIQLALEAYRKANSKLSLQSCSGIFICRIVNALRIVSRKLFCLRCCGGHFGWAVALVGRLLLLGGCSRWAVCL
jgi:hypothetical protein